MSWGDEWARFVREAPQAFRYATEAHHQLGDISRPEGGFVRIDETVADDENYYGNWLTGLGFINVRFPKATTRELTAEEIEWLAEHPVVMA